jgi:hypothetical protein
MCGILDWVQKTNQPDGRFLALHAGRRELFGDQCTDRQISVEEGFEIR